MNKLGSNSTPRNLTANVSLSPFTTFHLGGPARIFIKARSDSEVEDGIKYARERNLTIFPLGAGSNILVPDVGVDGVVMKMVLRDLTMWHDDDGVILVAGAGTPWDDVVDIATEHGFFGIENLAGIPGTVGGALVQNIGAYGAELADVFEYADVINCLTSEHKRINRVEACLGYRTSSFKEHREYIIVRIALRLSNRATPNVVYRDLDLAQKRGIPLSTSREIVRAVRDIRANKFPSISEEGTAGSFFKNPIVDEGTFALLRAKYPDMPEYQSSTRNMSNGRKIPLAWLLDHTLSLNGFSKGRVRLYEKQPLVIVASAGATASEVDEFAREVAERVFIETGILIEREVEIFGTRT